MGCYNKRWFCFRSVPTINSSDENGDENDPKKEIIKPSEFTAVELTSLTAIDGEANSKPETDVEKEAKQEKSDVEKPQTEVETSSHETPIRFSKFLNLFKRPNQKTMEPMDEDDNEVEDNDEKTDEDQEKQGKENIEFEPDTKPTDDEPLNPELTPSKSIELEEGEKSPPLSSSPKNTAV